MTIQPSPSDESILQKSAYAVAGLAFFTLFVAFALRLTFDFVEVAYFLVTLAGLIGAIAIGLYYRRRWAYYGFKTLLYLMLPSFPLGTCIAYLTLKSFRKRNLKRFFR